MNFDSLKVINTEGETLQLTGNLIGYLSSMQRAKEPEFVFGDWLSTLSDPDLNQIKMMADAWLTQKPESSPELISIIATITGFRKQSKSFRLDIEELFTTIQMVHFCSSLESIKRKGWVEIQSDLTLDGHKEVEFSLTPLGEQNIAEIEGFPIH